MCSCYVLIYLGFTVCGPEGEIVVAHGRLSSPARSAVQVFKRIFELRYILHPKTFLVLELKIENSKYMNIL